MPLGRAFIATIIVTLAACGNTGGLGAVDGVVAPGVDTRAKAVSGVEVAHRLVAAGEYELALKAFSRAALADGMNAEILSGIGTANLGLGRLGQAESALRRATTEYEAWPEIYNNLGVVLMEQGNTAEAVQIFRKAYALDDGESTPIRDNLRLALAKLEKPDTVTPQDGSYTLVRRGSSDYLLRASD